MKFRYLYIGKQGLDTLPGLRPDTVKSGNIQYVAYSIEMKELRLVFGGGSEYSYQGVPQHVYIGLLNAESPGQFFDTHVKKGGYAYEKVESIVAGSIAKEAS